MPLDPSIQEDNMNSGTIEMMKQLRDIRTKCMDELDNVLAERADLLEVLKKIANYGSQRRFISSDVLLIQVWANKAIEATNAS